MPSSARPRACGAGPSRGSSCRSRARAARSPGRCGRRRRRGRWSCRARSCRRDGSTASRGICRRAPCVSPSIMRRATAIISPKWMSAVASATIGGTTVTGMPRLVASATSILSGVIDIERDRAQFRIGGQHRAVDLVMQQREQNVAFFTAAISLRLGDDLARSVIDLDGRDRAQPLERARGDRLGDKDARILAAHRSHRTTPATPSTAHCAPSGIVRVASSTPSTIGMPRSRASEARCEVEPPSSATTPATRGRIWLSAGPATLRDQDVAGRDARQFTFAVDHHGAARTPADAGGMAVEAGMLQPDLVRHDRRLRHAAAAIAAA